MSKTDKRLDDLEKAIHPEKAPVIGVIWSDDDLVEFEGKHGPADLVIEWDDKLEAEDEQIN